MNPLAAYPSGPQRRPNRQSRPCQCGSAGRSPYRRHSPQFKLQLCHDIRAGTIGRKEAQRKYALSANLVQLWLTQYDRGELDAQEVDATLVTEYEAKIA